jgi:hypothetical protein
MGEDEMWLGFRDASRPKGLGHHSAQVGEKHCRPRRVPGLG